MNKWREKKVLILDNITQHKKWVEQELSALESKWDKKEIPLTQFDAETHYVLRMLLNAIELLETR